MSAQPLLTVQDCAQRLNFSEQLVRRLCGSGKLPASKIGGEWRVDPAALEAFIAGARPQPVTPPESCDLPAVPVRRFA